MARQTITVKDMGRMSVDDQTGRLYWDGKEVVTTLTLPWWGQVAIIITAVSTATMAISTVAPQIASLF